MKLKKILLIEDDHDQRLGLEIRLEAAGLLVNTAPDIRSSIKSAACHRPDVIILDLGLPDGDGFEAIQRFKEHPETAITPIIVLTAYGSTENLARSFQSEQVVTFLEKPVSTEELLRTIELALTRDKPTFL